MKNLYKNYWLICLVFFAFSSCNNDDGEELFTESPAERISQRVKELSNLLTSQTQGYKGVYFTKNDEFGGFTFYMKFNADNTVEMTSDFDSETSLAMSSYEVRFGTTTELVFTTRNHIQKVSDPQLPGAIGTGFKGTSVFQYFTTNNGVLTFRDVRNRDTGYLVFTPTGFTDFQAESIASAEKTLVNRASFVNSDAVTAFPFMSVGDGTNVTEYALNYNKGKLFANPTTTNDDESVSDVKFGIAFTEDGLFISPALELKGVKFEKFTLDKTSGFEYVSIVNGITAKIGYGNKPVTPLDAYDFGVRRNRAWLNRDEPAKSSNAFNNFYNEYDASLLATYGISIRFIIFRSLNDGSQPYIHIFTTGGAFWYDLNFTITDGIVVFTPTGATNASPGVTGILQPILDTLLGGVSGFYLNKTGSLEGFSNRTFSMINVADPRFEINYWDQ